VELETVQAAIGKRLEPGVFEYKWQDVVLYALSVGAQTDEIRFIYENAPDGLEVIPSFGAVSLDLPWDIEPELQMEPARTIHGENHMWFHRPFPPSGKFVTMTEISNIYDKGKSAIVIVRNEIATESGDPMFDNEALFIYLGGGGFGGDHGPKRRRVRPPVGVDPDFTVSYPVPETQAALYRLNGDINPLHIDPAFAKTVGFTSPILHGLCSVGYVTRAVLHAACSGDVARIKELKVRFSAPVFPGDTLTTEGWKEPGGRCIIQVSTDRTVVINNAYAVVAD